MQGVMSIEHLHSTPAPLPVRPSQHAVTERGLERDRNQGAALDDTETAAPMMDTNRVPASPSRAIDINRLSAANLAQQDLENEDIRDLLSQGPGSILADDSFESIGSVMGDDSKNEIRRRRRTRPDEANLLAQVYAKNPFPDHETRLFLANRVGMSVRAVSVWFQNRRQAEKKRSGRYGGSGAAQTTAAPRVPSGVQAPAAAEGPLSRPPIIPSQRVPFGNASANGAGPAKVFDPQEIKDLSSNNKENIPPWLAGRDARAPLQHQMEQVKRGTPLTSLLKKEVTAARPVAHDLRQAVGPDGAGIAVHRVEVDNVAPVQAAAKVDRVVGVDSAKTSLSRHRSAPRMSLEDVLGGRSKSLRRSATEHVAAPLANASSEMEEEQLDTILPPPKLLSRASSASNLSLMTTSGGRASIGSLDLRKESTPTAAAKDVKPSLTSSLPPKLTAALQRQGIIAMHPATNEQAVRGKGLLQMMPSSSASSSEADALFGNDQRRDGDEDEERTLKMIAQRRAAKAQAAALAKAQEARERAASSNSAVAPVPMDPGCADARQAIVQQAQASSGSSSLVIDGASIESFPKKSSSAVVGLGPARQLSLDWAAGRDRAATSALPNSIGGTPLSRSVSARQLTVPGPNESTPIAEQRKVTSMSEPKRKVDASKPSRRSLSATDLTRRLQEAKRKGDTAQRSVSAGRKRTAAAAAAPDVRDENVDPASAIKSATQAAQPVKRRRAQLEDIVLASSMAEPALPSKSHASFSAGMPAPASPLLSSRPFASHASFPSASRSMPTMVIPSTPQSTSLYSSTLPLSTRSERFRAIGASPAGSLGRSISANYASHRHAIPRASAARDSAGPNRAWDLGHARAYSNGEDGWTPRSTMSQPLPASTPSRVLGDRTNFGSTPSHHRTHLPGNSSGDSPFVHDDSGFFEGMSDDEQPLPRQAAGAKSKGGKGLSPRKASLRRSGESGDDHQAAELLLGLGKTVDSRDSSSSQ
uniref:Homeobox domain-containing protein n=2 Tax=Kalmanozyma brasiliensis (strain GHG001) TaxID=1365824 RepID=V5F331_KALBG